MADRNTKDDASRNRMMGEIADGIGEDQFIDCSGKSVLCRGCDPQMATRASAMVVPLLGNPEFVSCCDDDDFIAKLQEKKWSVIFFAPGACRYSAARMQIPGARSNTKGWTLKQYRTLVQQHQGADVPIVETTEEREVVPRLRSALSKAKR